MSVVVEPRKEYMMKVPVEAVIIDYSQVKNEKKHDQNNGYPNRPLHKNTVLCTFTRVEYNTRTKLLMTSRISMIYLVFPIYNEQKSLAKTIDELRAQLSKDTYQIIAVDDGSTDRSLYILKRLKAKDLEIEHYHVNMNIGAVFATGIDRVLSSASDRDIIVIMEADGTSSPHLVNSLTKSIQSGADIVIASRYTQGGGYAGFPFSRRIFSSLANRVMSFYFPIAGVRDYTIFYRAYRVSVV